MPARRKVQVLSTFTGFRRGNAVDAATACPHGAVKGKSSRPSQNGVKKPTTMMFERFTEKAIKVVMLAQEESRRLGHNFVGTEQILLGLIGEATGIAAKVLKQMGVNLKEARAEVEKVIGRGSGFVAVEIPFTPRAKRVLELSLEEARQLGKPHRGVVLTGESCPVTQAKLSCRAQLHWHRAHSFGAFAGRRRYCCSRVRVDGRRLRKDPSPGM